MKGSIFWDVTVPRLMNIYASTVFVLLWLGFIAALVINRQWLDMLWNWVQGLPPFARIFLWVVLTPVMATLGIWESSWSTPGKLAGFTGILAWTLIAVWNLFKNFR